MDPGPDFDPYVEWLDIDPARLPPDYYDLLSLPPFESDPEKIEKAFETRWLSVRRHQTGPRGKFTQELLNELTRARICLLNDQTRSEYDDSIRMGEAKPPISIANLVADALPPIQEDRFVIESTDGTEAGSSGSAGGPGSRKKFATLYVLVCLTVVLGLWFFFKGPNGGANPDEPGESETSQKKEPAAAPKKRLKIVNLIEEKKGILPGANNSFLLDSGNGTLGDESPEIVETPRGKFLGQWKSADDFVEWEIWIENRGYYEAIVKYRAQTNDDFSRLVLRNGDAFTKKIKMRNSESADDFFEEEFVLLFRKGGTQVLRFSVEGEVGDFRLESILLRPNRTR